MIIDSLKNSARIESLHPLFAKAFDYIKTHDLLNENAGRVVLEEGVLWINIDEPNGKKKEEARIENHCKYIDIQLLLKGEETYGWKESSQLKESTIAYNDAKDIAFWGDEPTTYFTLYPGQFVVFYPEDGHAPCISKQPMKKLVVKVKI